MRGALKDLKKKGLNIKLLILGNPDPHNLASIKDREIIKWQSKGLIIWKKKVTNVLPYLQKSRISILPSYREGLPKSLLEAASCGLPIIATDVPGCRECIIHNENGFIVEPQNAESLVEAINKFIQNPNMIKKMGLKSYQIVEEKFSNGKIFQQYLELL